MNILESELRGPKIISSDIPVTRIGPSRSWRSLNLKEIWDYRELLYFFDLARRKGKVQTDYNRRRLGDLATVDDNDRFYARVQEDRQHFFRGYPIPNFRFHGSPALEPIRRFN